MSVTDINTNLYPYIIDDIRKIIINYIFMKCDICNNMEENLPICECNNTICYTCIKICVGCNTKICINCDICDDCNTIYRKSILFMLT